MSNQNIGYIRVSSTGQNTDRQLADVQLDRIFTDKISGKDINRPQLTECLSFIRSGDTLHVHSIDRLARNLNDLQKLITDLTNNGITVNFHKENMVFFEGSVNSAMNIMMLQMLGSFAQFERAVIKERQMEGIAAAKAKGKKLGAPSKLNPGQIEELKRRAVSEPHTKLAMELGISRPTLYKIIKP